MRRDTSPAIAGTKPTIASASQRFAMISMACLLLAVGSSGITIGGRYIAGKSQNKASALAPTSGQSITGLNMAVSSSQLQSTLDGISAQTSSLNIGDLAVPVPADTIKSWVKVSPSSDGSKDYLHMDTTAVANSFTALVSAHSKGAVDEVVATHDDGTSAVIVAGANGVKADPTAVAKLANQAALAVMNHNSFNLNVPLVTAKFASVTPSAFPKLLEVNIVTKRMYAYDNGVLTKTFLISAGAAATPSPIGEYKIFEKLPVQDMHGFNPNGTPYFQPHVRWINYFLTGGYAVHGNYWRPVSWFGVKNSSHGCVSLPDDQAKWVYDWAPIGTTVITHI